MLQLLQERILYVVIGYWLPSRQLEMFLMIWRWITLNVAFIHCVFADNLPADYSEAESSDGKQVKQKR